jgi:hypothetical protein
VPRQHQLRCVLARAERISRRHLPSSTRLHPGSCPGSCPASYPGSYPASRRASDRASDRASRRGSHSPCAPLLHATTARSPDVADVKMVCGAGLLGMKYEGQTARVTCPHFGDNTGNAKAILVQSNINVVSTVSYGATTTSNVSPTLLHDTLNVAIQG